MRVEVVWPLGVLVCFWLVYSIISHIHYWNMEQGFVVLRGFGPKFRVSWTNQQSPTLSALSETNRVAQAVVSPKEVLGDDTTMFLHPEVYVMGFCYS